MALDFTNAWPFNKIQPATIDGQSMVYIPKIYVNNTKLTDGPYAGKYQYSIAPDKISDDWHLHPAFKNKGAESDGIYISAYLASKDSSGKAASVSGSTPWTNMTRDSAHSLGSNRNVSGGGDEKQGWHMYNIYEHHLIARLMLIEFGSSDIQTLLTNSNTGNGATYHGIHDVYGGTSYCFWIDGFDTLGASNKIRIFDNDGGQTYTDTGLTPCGGTWMKDCLHDKGSGFDMGDVFIAKTAEGTQANGSFGDYQGLHGGDVFCAAGGAVADCGPFCLGDATSSHAYSLLGFRLAKYA